MPSLPEFSRRNALGLLGGGAAAAALSACGGNSSSTPAPATSASASASGSASPSPTASSSVTPSGKPSLAAPQVDGPTLTIWADSARIPYLVKASAAFTEKFKVNVKFQPFAFGDLFTMVQQAGPSGNGPDLWDCNFDWTGKLIAAGLLAPVELGDKAASLDKRAVAGYTQDGVLYALPQTLESTFIYRNTDLIPDPIETWDDFTKIAANLADKGIKYPFMHVPNAYVYNAMLTGFGGYLYKPPAADGSLDTADVGIDNSGAQEALAYYQMLAQKKYQRPGVDDNVVAKVFAKQGGLLFSGPWNVPTLQGAKANFAIDMCPAGPAGPAVPYLSARGMMVNKVGTQVALAQTFLTEYFAAPEPMSILAKAANLESAWTEVKDASATPLVKDQIKAGANAQPIPSDGRFNDYYQPMTDAMTSIVAGQTTPQKALKTVKAKFDSAK